MDHAKTISRNGKITEKRNSASTAQAVEQFRQLDEQTKGCRGNPQGQEKVCTSYDVANAFLKMQFPKRLHEIEEVQDNDKLKMEREFYKSLSNIIKKFELEIQDFRNIPFPYNISESLKALRLGLMNNKEDWKDVRLIHANNSTYFAREERYCTGMTLYYIPVIPLYTLLQSKKTETVGNLLLSVYAYLYHVLHIPYYRGNDCYLNHTYQVLDDWIVDDGADEETIEDNNEAKKIGDCMKVKIKDPINLRYFGRRIKNFKPKNDFDGLSFRVAKEFFELFQNYPNVPIYRKFYPLRFRDESDDYERTVMLDDYISFCASIKGNLFDSLIETVNSDLQEYGEIDEPTIFIPYDGRKIDENNFDFERAVFRSLDNLIRLWQESIY